MEINLLILGIIFILTLFTVGESVFKHFKVHKFIVLLILTILIIGVFMPPIELFGYALSFDKIIFPFALCFCLSFMIKRFSRFIFNVLFSIFVSVLYLLLGADVANFIIQPSLILGLFLGGFVGLNSTKLSECFPAIFFGINLGTIIFYVSKYESLETMFYEANIFSAVLIGWITSTLMLFLKHKMLKLSQNYKGANLNF